MNTKEEKFLTINNYNIIGQKTDIDINIIKQYPKLEEIKIKNFDISNELIELLNNLQNLKKIFLVNCTINANKTVNKIKILELSNCYFTNLGKVFKNVEILQLRDCKNIDINHILNFKLQTLKILNTKIINFRSIQNIDTLENLYLNEVDLNNELNYKMLTKLKKINFDGSFINNKKEFLSQFETKNINISFSKNYEEIG